MYLLLASYTENYVQLSAIQRCYCTGLMKQILPGLIRLILGYYGAMIVTYPPLRNSIRRDEVSNGPGPGPGRLIPIAGSSAS